MNKLMMALMALMVVFVTGCSDDDDVVLVAPSGPNGPAGPLIPAGTGPTALSPAGDTTLEAIVANRDIFSANGEKDVTLDSAVASFPNLTNFVATLRAVTAVRETTVSHLELYADDELIVVFTRENDTAPWTVIESLNNFLANTIVYTPPSFNEKPTPSVPVNGSLNLALTECLLNDATSCATVTSVFELKQTNIKIGDQPVIDLNVPGPVTD